MEESFAAEFNLTQQDIFSQPFPGGPRLIIMHREILTMDNPLFKFYTDQHFTDVGIGGHEDCHFYEDLHPLWGGNREKERQHHIRDLGEFVEIMAGHWPWARFYKRYATVTPDKSRIARIEKIM